MDRLTPELNDEFYSKPVYAQLQKLVADGHLRVTRVHGDEPEIISVAFDHDGVAFLQQHPMTTPSKLFTGSIATQQSPDHTHILSFLGLARGIGLRKSLLALILADAPDLITKANWQDQVKSSSSMETEKQEFRALNAPDDIEAHRAFLQDLVAHHEIRYAPPKTSHGFASVFLTPTGAEKLVATYGQSGLIDANAGWLHKFQRPYEIGEYTAAANIRELRKAFGGSNNLADLLVEANIEAMPIRKETLWQQERIANMRKNLGIPDL